MIKALAPLSSLQMEAVSQKFSGTFGKGLTSELTGEVGGYFKYVLQMFLVFNFRIVNSSFSQRGFEGDHTRPDWI